MSNYPIISHKVGYTRLFIYYKFVHAV